MSAVYLCNRFIKKQLCRIKKKKIIKDTRFYNILLKLFFFNDMGNLRLRIIFIENSS